MEFDVVKNQIKRHAERESPKEACGAIIGVNGKPVVVECKNTSHDPANLFQISPQELSQAMEKGELIAIYHSHPNGTCRPSSGDKAACMATGYPYLIYGMHDDRLYFMEESGRVPLIGRPFVHGLLDCYAIIKDFYDYMFDINLPNQHRQDYWWKKGENLYDENFKQAGFYEISMDELEPGDALMMQIEVDVVNHAAIYLGNNEILHHSINRLSKKEVLAGYWLKNTRRAVRHHDRCDFKRDLGEELRRKL